MNIAVSTMLRVASNGLSKRTLTDAQCDTLRKTRLPHDALETLACERAEIYAGNKEMATADVLEAMWKATGVTMTLDAYCETMQAVKEMTDDRRVEAAQVNGYDQVPQVRSDDPERRQVRPVRRTRQDRA